MPKFNIVCTPQIVTSTLGNNGGRATFSLKIGGSATGHTSNHHFKITGIIKDNKGDSLYIANKVIDLAKGALLTYGNYDCVYQPSKGSKGGLYPLTLVVTPVSKSGVSIGAPQKVTVTIKTINGVGSAHLADTVITNEQEDRAPHSAPKIEIYIFILISKQPVLVDCFE